VDGVDVSVVVGNPKAQSRTLQIALDVAGHLLESPSDRPTTIIDLVEYTGEIFDWSSERMTSLAEAVRTSDVVVFASPTYKATYTGLLKSFLDRYPGRALKGVVAIPVMTGASLGHAMAVDIHLRSVLVELGATVPTGGLYFVTTEPEMARKDEIVAAWAADNADVLDAIRRDGST